MTTSSNNEMPEAIAEAMGQPPSEVCLNIIAFRNAHQIKALEHLPVYVKVFEDTFESLAKAIDGLNLVEKANWKEHNTLQVVFLSKVPKTLFSAFQQIMNGDYYEALATCRIAYETLLRVCFIELSPAHQFTTIKAVKGSPDFKPTNFLRDNLKVVDKDPFYESLSLPVHSHKYSVLKDMVKGQQNGGLLFDLGFGYNEKDLQYSFNYLMAITYLAVRLFQGLFNSFLDGSNFELKKTDAIETLITDMPHDFNTLPTLIGKILLKFG
jgi:hypothetical protein